MKRVKYSNGGKGPKIYGDAEGLNISTQRKNVGVTVTSSGKPQARIDQDKLQARLNKQIQKVVYKNNQGTGYGIERTPFGTSFNVTGKKLNLNVNPTSVSGSFTDKSGRNYRAWVSKNNNKSIGYTGPRGGFDVSRSNNKTNVTAHTNIKDFDIALSSGRNTQGFKETTATIERKF